MSFIAIICSFRLKGGKKSNRYLVRRNCGIFWRLVAKEQVC